MRRALIALTLTVATAALLAETYASRRNTLHRNGRWVSGKLELDRAVMGAVAFLTTRTTLSRDRLDLSKYFGFQEVLWRDPLALDEVDCDFELDGGGVLAFLYGGGDDGGFEAIRVGGARNEALHVAHDGEFSARQPLALAPLAVGRHRLRARLQDDYTMIWIDGALVAHRPPVRLARQRFGFRGGYAPVLIDRVVIKERDGRVTVETFRNSRDFWRALAIGGASLLALQALMLTLTRRRGRAALLVLDVSLLVGAATFHVVDDRWLSARYPPVESVDFAGYESRIEGDRAVRDRVLADYRPAPAPGVTRVMFLGSSQTWGAGALAPGDVFAARIEARLNREAGGRFQVINTGISGANSPSLRELYEHEWAALGPRLLVVNLCNNDGDLAVFRTNLRALAAFNRARDIRTLFVIEGNIPEQHVGGWPQADVMREVARETATPIADLYGHLLTRLDSGFVFWDEVHLTSHGQRLAADFLYPQVAALLK